MLQFDAYCHAYLIKVALGPDTARQGLYPLTFTDIEGKPLVLNQQLYNSLYRNPLARAFWSLTPYNFLNNPINRYDIWMFTEGLKKNRRAASESWKRQSQIGYRLPRIHLTLFCVCICQKNKFLTEHALQYSGQTKQLVDH